MKTSLKSLIAIAAIAMVAPMAHADDGVWKVGSSYVVRFDKLDLAQPVDRQILLAQIERASTKACRNEQTRARRQTCQTVNVNIALGTLQPNAREAVETARLERTTQMQAQR